MSELEQASTQDRLKWVLPLALVLGVGAWVGLRKLDDPPPTPPIERTSPGAKAVAESAAGSTAARAPTGAPPAVDAATVDAAFAASQAAERAGDLELAYAQANLAARGGGRSARLQLAKLAILRKDPAAAIRPLEDILRENPDDADALYNLALAWQQHPQPSYTKSRASYLATLRAEPRYAAARYNLVVLCVDHGKLNEAKAQLDIYGQEWPNDPNLPVARNKYAKALAKQSGAAPEAP